MRLITIILSILITITSSMTSFADEKNVKNYSFENDIKMSGVISTTGKFFNISKNWNVENAKLNLVFTKSELLDIDYSTITVLINDTPIHSQRLDGKKEYKKETAIEIPKDLIKEGFNEIKIKAYKTISDMVCRDDSNTANWLVIHKESNISVDYNYKEASNQISEYNNLYMNLDNGSRLNTTILIPDSYSSSELTSGMILSSDIGKNLKNESFKFDFNLYSDFKNKNDNIIYIGKENNTSKEILNLLTEDEKNKLNENCIIKQANSIFNKEKKMIIIISNKDGLLENASRLISSDELIKNLNTESMIINENTDVDDLNKKLSSNRVYLKDLGYDNIIEKGPFSQETIIDIKIPKNKIVTDGSKVKFNIRYAQNLDFERSLATVYINEIPIGSKKLSKEKSNNDTIELKLPKEIFNYNYYQIKVVFNLELLDLACVTRETDNPWAYISNDSFIDFLYADNKNLNFKNYPNPFVNNDKFDDLKVIIPDSSSSEDLTNISNIISYIGRDVNINSGDFTVLKSSEIKNEDKKSNLIIIGTPKNNQLIKDINKNLNLKFKSDYSGFESDDNIKFVGKYASEIASIQLIESPYERAKATMVVSSTNPKDLSLVRVYLSDLRLTKELKGDTVIIDRNGYIKDLSYKESSPNTKESINTHKTLSSEAKIFILVAIFLFITLITSIAFLVLKYRK
ncbi:cellulose biosynthesis cyclic di-GMP-binding regulatory protein BcsB [Romboutsia lituseburensis]|uniref:cellulose biosynthesis cyclic di-GMP-binding regulatory protein BcsB n=1 Tax=Romboutsia lituseburensis TaxID=1537 RepID=UPI00215A942A|nr:cellulose biosynthesis cyclic di-GMP-binding regulatory protein BcsB [Romboutsia lituseburensis]MCR8743999.1 cellulose biosynthesis cyclic di-GMP-binding regulatory protein BcsB [Romboutsia lituseburensis]